MKITRHTSFRDENSDEVTTEDAPIAVERGIATLIDDAITLAMESETHSDYSFQDTLARASILSSTLFLEACANACLDMLNLGRRFSNEIDRLPTIAKFDLFLRMRSPRSSIDRSRSEFQGYSEMKALRDAFVHPKAQRYDWITWSEESSKSSSPRSATLDLAKIPAYCSSGDAVTALRASHSFASYILKECAKISSVRVSTLFYSEAVVPVFGERVAPCWDKSVRKWLHEKNIDVKYMRIVWL